MHVLVSSMKCFYLLCWGRLDCTQLTSWAHCATAAIICTWEFSLRSPTVFANDLSSWQAPTCHDGEEKSSFVSFPNWLPATVVIGSVLTERPTAQNTAKWSTNGFFFFPLEGLVPVVLCTWFPHSDIWMQGVIFHAWFLGLLKFGVRKYSRGISREILNLQEFLGEKARSLCASWAVIYEKQKRCGSLKLIFKLLLIFMKKD